MKHPDVEPIASRPALHLTRWLAIVLAISGIGITAYLSWLHLSGGSAFCTVESGCDIVRQSSYAQIKGVPIALLGLLAYVTIFFALALEGKLAGSGINIVLVTSLSGTLYSGYLTYLELFVIHAICPYCVASAVVMTAILFVAAYRFRVAWDTA